MYCIYVITNKTNFKKYVGQTNNLKRRWARHKYEAFTKANKKPLYCSIRKYGIENFYIEEIIQCNKESVDELEIFYVQQFKSNQKEFGYNLTTGGQLQSKMVIIQPKIPSMLGKHHSLESKQKMSEQRKGSKNAFYGKKHSDESKQKMSNNPNRKYMGETNPFFGKHFNGCDNSFSKLTDEIVLAARKLHHEDGLTFTELSKLYNVSESAISRAIRKITWKHI